MGGSDDRNAESATAVAIVVDGAMICYECYAEEHDRCDAKKHMMMDSGAKWAMRCDCTECKPKETPMELCWFNRFSETEIPCSEPGTWRGTENSITAAMRWCDRHKHESDIKVTNAVE